MNAHKQGLGAARRSPRRPRSRCRLADLQWRPQRRTPKRSETGEGKEGGDYSGRREGCPTIYSEYENNVHTARSRSLCALEGKLKL